MRPPPTSRTAQAQRLLALVVAATAVLALGACASTADPAAESDPEAAASSVPAPRPSRTERPTRTPTPEPTDPPGPNNASIFQVFDSALTEYGVPGGAISVTYDGDSAAHAFGLADVEADVALTPEDAGAYRSVTKSLVVTVLLQLVDEGKVGLDDPISAYVDQVPNGDAITLRQLAGMRSGLANYSAQRKFGQALEADPLRQWTKEEIFTLGLRPEPAFAPGAAFQYSNTNTVLLGAVIEKVEGRPWAESVAQRIAEPLGLTSVTYPLGVDLPIAPYQVTEGKAELLPRLSPTGFSAAGGLAGSVVDLDRWARALGSGELLSPESHAARTAEMSDPTEDPASPLYDAYGLGIGELRGWLGHTGTGAGYQSLALYDPESGASVAILLNATGGDPDLPAQLFAYLDDRELFD